MPLLERESRGVIMTPLGREVHEQALRVLDEVLLLETMGKRFEAGPFRVVVGIVSTLAPYLLAGLLERLQAASSRVELDVLEAPGQDLVSSLLAGRLDAAVLSLPWDCWNSLSGRCSKTVFCSPDARNDWPHSARWATPPELGSGPVRHRTATHARRRPLPGRPGAGRVLDVAPAGCPPRRGVARHSFDTGGKRCGPDAASGIRGTLRAGDVSRPEISPSRRARTVEADRSRPSRGVSRAALDRSRGRGSVGCGRGARARGARGARRAFRIAPMIACTCPWYPPVIARRTT